MADLAVGNNRPPLYNPIAKCRRFNSAKRELLAILADYRYPFTAVDVLVFVKEDQTLLHQPPCFTPAAVALALHSMHLAIIQIAMTQENVFVRHLNILECAFRGLILAMGTAV